MRNALLVVIALIVCAPIAACCGNIQCESCAPAISLNIVDATTGDPLADASVSVTPPVGVNCSSPADYCQVSAEAGTYELIVAAAGYQSSTFQIEVPESDGDGCCDCGYEPVSQTVQLASSP